MFLGNSLVGFGKSLYHGLSNEVIDFDNKLFSANLTCSFISNVPVDAINNYIYYYIYNYYYI